MKSRKSHTMIASCLAALMLLSTVSFSINFHYCQGNLRGLSFFGVTSSCHDGKNSCPKHSNVHLEEKEINCCSNQEVVIDDLDDDYTSIQLLELNDFKDVYLAINSNFLSDTDIQFYQDAEYQNYKPPLPTRDIPVLFQSFLL